MTDISAVENGQLFYSCNCGWIDRNHSDPTEYRENMGAASLVRQIKFPANSRAARLNGVWGHRVTYRQDVGVAGGRVALIWNQRDYWVRAGMSEQEQESAALAIFMEISLEFERNQYDNWMDSGFSVEDLVSNLVGFYRAFRPMQIDVRYHPDYCNPPGGAVLHSSGNFYIPDQTLVQRSVAVWQQSGAVGGHKNRTFYPEFFPCEGCPPPDRVVFPRYFRQIRPMAIPTEGKIARMAPR